MTHESLMEMSHEELATLCLSLRRKVDELAAEIEVSRRRTPKEITYSHDPIRRKDKGVPRPGWWTRVFSRVPVLDPQGVPTGKFATAAGWRLLKDAGEDFSKAAKLLAKIKKGGDKPAPVKAKRPIYLGELVEQYITEKMNQNKIGTARATQIRGAAALLLGDPPRDRLIEKYIEKDIKAAVGMVVDGRVLQPATRAFRLRALRALFAFAIKEKLLAGASPCQGIEFADVNATVTGKSPIKVWPQDREKLVKAAYEQDLTLGHVVDFLYRTGWRPIMACRLTFSAVDLATGEIHVSAAITRKNRNERITKISAVALEILKARALLAKREGAWTEDALRGHLVFWKEDNKPLRVDNLGRQFKALVSKTGVRGQFTKRPTLYCLRKGFAQDLSEFGATAYAKQAAMCDVSGVSTFDQSTRETMAALGHSDPNMAPRHYLDGREALEQVLGKLPGKAAN